MRISTECVSSNPYFAPFASSHDLESKALYFGLSSRQPTERALCDASHYLERQLQTAAALDADIPEDPYRLPAWVEDNATQVGQQYAAYLEQRRAGAARRFFSNRSHALNFLRSVAPTKMVDGSWLYGMVARWRDDRFAPLIRIYLEELGDGLPEKNHVVLYKKLLAAHGCDQWQSALDDEHFVQGAIQLALAYHADAFLPEVIGFNLGYEQLPLHLPITAYELNELGIDPYYFTLHITVDNAATGHAQKAANGLLALLPQLGGGAEFYRRVLNGYKLNLLGASTTSVIAAFDLEQEMVKVLRGKSFVGQHMHSDFCRIGGRSVNAWLADPERIPDMLQALQQNGWIERHADPHQSRFWRLLEGERAEMFGVFNAYEKQVIYDWILGDAASMEGNGLKPQARTGQLTFRARQRLLRTLEPHAAVDNGDAMSDENDVDVCMLEAQLAQAQNRQEMMDILGPLLSPAMHHTPCGLMATRVFSGMLDQYAQAA